MTKDKDCPSAFKDAVEPECTQSFSSTFDEDFCDDWDDDDDDDDDDD